jgi:cytochrome c peroxidase
MPKRVIVAAAALAGTACLMPGTAAAQAVNPQARAIISSMPPGTFPKWFPPMLNQALSIPVTPGTPFPQGTKPPTVIPQSEVTVDPAGTLGSYQPGGQTITAKNAFFLSLGTNGRTCFSCHQPASGMSISTANLQALYRITGDKDPVFAAVDGADCPNKPHSHGLLLNKGLFRIFLPVPSNAEFTVTVVSDPTGCNTNPAYATGVDPTTNQPVQIVSVYRRPLVATDLKFVTDLNQTRNTDPITGQPLPIDLNTGLVASGNIMWDGREQTLATQAWHATAGHAQAAQAQLDQLGLLNSQGQIPVITPEMAQIIAFENGIYSAQLTETFAGSLTVGGATGGPVNLALAVINVPDTADPAFSVYAAWSSASSAKEQSIYRGMQIFLGGKTFPINNVSGIGNIPVTPPGVTPVVTLGQTGALNAGSCSTCHSAPNSGTDSFPAAQHDIGIGGTSQAFGGPAPSADLPIFKVTYTSTSSSCTGPAGYHGSTVGSSMVYTNDLGAAMITGCWRDVGRLTVPPLRGLASRAPYFSDGSAQTLLDVVNFYNTRFNIGLSNQDKQDLVNFLNAL